MTDAVKMVTGVTRDDAVKFLEQACRNWRHVPHLSNEDIADVMVALAVFARKANPANPTCNDSLQVAAPVKERLTPARLGQEGDKGEVNAELDWLSGLAKKSVDTAGDCDGIDAAVDLIRAALSEAREAGE